MDGKPLKKEGSEKPLALILDLRNELYRAEAP
jgi:hypothetical protein